MAKDGSLTTLEIDPKHADVARRTSRWPASPT